MTDYIIAVTPEEKGPIENSYDFSNELGRGAFSTVRIGINKKNNNKVAIKSINKDGELPVEILQSEVSIMRKINNHPNVICLKGLFESAEEIHLVLEVAEGGELFDYIVARGNFTEDEACNIFKQMLDGVLYIHNNDVVHRDLKPENLLLSADKTHLKVSDFGLAAECVGDSCELTQCCGSPSYVAPEVLEGTPYGKRVDGWSAGVILYILLSGYQPFSSSKDIVNGRYSFPDRDWSTVSNHAIDLIRKLLTVDPTKRLTIEQALQHPWVTGKDTIKGQLSEYYMENIKAFNAKRKLKGVVLAAIAVGQLREGLAALAARTTAAHASQEFVAVIEGEEDGGKTFDNSQTKEKPNNANDAKLGKRWTLNVNENIKGTPIIKCSFMLKRGSRLKIWKRRWFILTDQYLAWYKNPSAKVPIRVLLWTYVEKIAECNRREGGDYFCLQLDTRKRYAFGIDKRKSYILSFSSLEDRQEWIESIQGAIFKNTRKSADSSTS